MDARRLAMAADGLLRALRGDRHRRGVLPCGTVFNTEAHSGDESVGVPRKPFGRADDAADDRAMAQQTHDAITQALVVVAEPADSVAEPSEVCLCLDLHS